MWAVAAALAAASFRQSLAYGLANASGLATNLVFLALRAGVLEACYTHRDTIGGLDPGEAASFAALTQAMLMVAPQWGTVGLGASIRSGQIAVDLLRPVDPWTLLVARRLGTSAFYALARMAPILAVSAAVGLLEAPSPTAALAWGWSLAVGALIAVEIQVLLECSAFWLWSDQGVRSLVYGFGVMASGLLLPLSWYPAGLQALLRATPFAGTLALPTECWLGTATLGAMAGQVGWAVGLGLAGWLALRVGLRRLVVHGG